MYNEEKIGVKVLKFPMRFVRSSWALTLRTFKLCYEEKVFKYLGLIFAVGLVGAFIFLAFESHQVEGLSWWEATVKSIYWSIVTLTTIGYGDITPQTVGGRIFVTLFFVAGMTVVSLFTANFASVLTTIRIREGKGVVNLSEMRNHFVICGWKRDMDQVVSEILNFCPGMKGSEIVIVANIQSDTLEAFKMIDKFSSINFIKGDYFNEEVLKTVNLKGARKVMVLSDYSSEASVTEVDSKTVMAVITIKSLAPMTYVVAELLDPKFEKYLKTAYCDEVLFSRGYSRALLANASSSSGISHVVSDLLDISDGAFMTTESFPDKFDGKTFAELRQYYMDKTGDLLIGILENTGSVYKLKHDALRDAQKTADISKLVNNLRIAKSLKGNNPVIHPENDWQVPRNSMAVVIKRISHTETDNASFAEELV